MLTIGYWKKLSEVVHGCARTVGGAVEGSSSHLRDVRVEIHLRSFAEFGSHASHPGPFSEACHRLEEALLGIRNPHILVHASEPNVSSQRAGRFQFWSLAIERTFPKLNERGLLQITLTPSTLSLVYCCRDNH